MNTTLTSVIARGVSIDVGAHPIRVIDPVRGEHAIDGGCVWSFGLVFGSRRNVALAEELAHFLPEAWISNGG